MIGIHDKVTRLCVIYLFTFVNVVVKKKIQAKTLNVPASREINKMFQRTIICNLFRILVLKYWILK